WGRGHPAGLGMRSDNHSSRPPRSGRGRGGGGGADPPTGGGARRGESGGASANRGERPQRVVAPPTLEANRRQLRQACTAGDPLRAAVLWTTLSLREWSRRLLGLGPPASRRTIRRVLRTRKLGRRTARKKKTMGPHPDRNAQCENIA